MTTETPTPEPCLRCGSVAPLTVTPRDELLCYTARLNLDPTGTRLETDLVSVDRQPRGRLCAACTRAFVGWLKEPCR
jgi:hypothetical protein